MFFSISSVTSLLVLLDYVWRAFQSVRIVRRFLGRSAIRLPRPDLSVDRAADSAGSLRSAFGLFATNPTFFLANLVFSPLGAAALAGVFAVLILSALAQAYVPVFREYSDVCVAGHGTKGNGTFLAQNLYAIAYNYAAVDGRGVYATEIDDYDATRGEHCSAYLTTSAAQQDEDALYLESLAAAQAGSSSNALLLGGCLDVGALDASFEAACCGLEGYGGCGAANGSVARCPLLDAGAASTPYAPLGSSLAEPACADDAASWALGDAVFDCADLPDCTVTCGGPSKPLLRMASQHCACSVEWYFHAALLKFCCGAAIYVLMNVARLLAVDALCRLNWRDAAAPRFTYTATCDGSGRPVARPEDGGGPGGALDAAAFSAALKTQLRARVAAWERAAYAELALAVALNVPWIVFLALLTDDLEYDPHES